MNKLKKKRRTMPIEHVYREEYEEWLSIFEEMDTLLGSMNYNPDATKVNSLHKRIKKILDSHDYRVSKSDQIPE